MGTGFLFACAAAAQAAVVDVIFGQITSEGVGGPVAEMLSSLFVLLIISLSGAFGGFVDGLLHQKSYFVRLGRWNKDVGSWGDALVGVTASLAIFTVAGAVLGIRWNNVSEPEHFIRVVAWGVPPGRAPQPELGEGGRVLGCGLRAAQQHHRARRQGSVRLLQPRLLRGTARRGGGCAQTLGQGGPDIRHTQRVGTGEL